MVSTLKPINHLMFNSVFRLAPPPQHSASDLANSFLNSVKQEIQNTNENPYHHEPQGRAYQ
jgi:hypothetical protein